MTDPGTDPGCSPSAPAHPRRPLAIAGETAHKQISTLQRSFLRDDPRAVATLARLRRGVGQGYAHVPDLWGLLDIDAVYEADASETELARIENAVHSAATLWALHQQGRRDRGMHKPDGTQLGSAVRQLIGDDVDAPARKRLVRAGGATTLDSLAQRLRELVVLLRDKQLPLDYGVLADQLHHWQRPGGPGDVRRDWGRSFHIRRSAAASDAPTTDTEESA